jgi:hypothetical protein
MHCLYEVLCQRFTRDALCLHTGKSSPKVPPAFAYSFRLPPLSNTFRLYGEIDHDVDVQEFDDDIDNQESDYYSFDPSVSGFISDTPEIASIREANGSLIKGLASNLTPNDKTAVHKACKRLQASVKGGIDTPKARDALAKYLNGFSNPVLRYICTDLALSIPAKVQKKDLTSLLVNWVSCFDLSLALCS